MYGHAVSNEVRQVAHKILTEMDMKHNDCLAAQVHTLQGYNVEVEGIDTKDYPDFCDAYISYAEHEDGTVFSDDELEMLNDNRDFVWNAVYAKLF
jgi:hypothetical protein